MKRSDMIKLAKALTRLGGPPLGKDFVAAKAAPNPVASAPQPPQQTQPFFPGGKTQFSLPDTSALNKTLTTPRPPPAGQMAFTPREVIAPYYQNAGGIDKAIGPAVAANNALAEKLLSLRSNLSSDSWLPPSTPTPIDLSKLDRRVPLIPAGFAHFDTDTGNIGLPISSGSWMETLLNIPETRRNEQGFVTGLADADLDIDDVRRVHFKDLNSVRAIKLPDVLRHELNHAVLHGSAGGFPSEFGPLRGQFDDSNEQEQGLASTKQETAALTGQIVKTPQDYDQLIKEINPADPDEAAFEQRIAPYSAEGQRYFRFLRLKVGAPEYYQKAIQRGRERMPLMVRLQNLLNNSGTKAAMTPQELNFQTGVETAGLNSPRNALTFALQVLAPPRVTPGMLRGLRQDRNQVDLLNRAPEGPPQLQNMTNEQLTALALKPILQR